MSNSNLWKIKERVENLSFQETYIRGDSFEGYSIKNKNNGALIAEYVPAESDAKFIQRAREDVMTLFKEIERLEEYLQDAHAEIKRGKDKRALNIIKEWDEESNLALNILKNWRD